MAKSWKKQAKRALKKTDARMFLLPLLCLLIGAALMFGLCRFVLGKNDGFSLTGDKQLTGAAGADFTYTDEGFSAVLLGMDRSAYVRVETNLTVSGDGTYTLPHAEAGTYYIAYVWDDPLTFGGGRLVRTIVIEGGETNG